MKGFCFVTGLLLAVLVACSESSTLRNGTVTATFRNPVADFPWPDPYVHRHNDGFYYMPRSENNGVAVYKSRTLSNFRGAERALVLTAPSGEPAFIEFFKPCSSFELNWLLNGNNYFFRFNVSLGSRTSFHQWKLLPVFCS